MQLLFSLSDVELAVAVYVFLYSLKSADIIKQRCVWFISINLKFGSGSEVWSLTESLTSSSNLDTCFFFEVAAGHFQGKASSLKVHQILTHVNVTQRLTGCHGGEAQCGANRGCVYRVITRKGCGQADTWASSQGAMFESVLKASCEIIDYGWTKDRAPVDTFIMGLATSIRERNDYEEEDNAKEKLAVPIVHPVTCRVKYVGLAAESKSGSSGADFLGPLLPAVAEICCDFDPTVDVEPSLMKLFRKLWKHCHPLPVNEMVCSSDGPVDGKQSQWGNMKGNMESIFDILCIE
ncbi:hypothetical protein L2E82_04741 [Cichorium intybus]|uniref:Uncharacterized protein n=1 Tax=Cichorium intybus TaxID=13427 RepID=A0ACB9H5X2_CICIN|nr:hypothetical protein L2E82_04741 [Cichorium intybus]